MINVSQLRDFIIKPTLKSIDLYSDAAENLLIGTCAQESKLGTYIKQVNGPALGIYQIEPATHKDVWENYLEFKPELANKVLLIGEKHDASLIVNLAYSTAIARIIYLRAPAELPLADDIGGLANYWKKYYNTELGKGKASEFIDNYRKLVGI